MLQTLCRISLGVVCMDLPQFTAWRTNNIIIKRVERGEGLRGGGVNRIFSLRRRSNARQWPCCMEIYCCSAGIILACAS